MHFKKLLFALIHLASLGLLQLWRDPRDENLSFTANLKKNLLQTSQGAVAKVRAALDRMAAKTMENRV